MFMDQQRKSTLVQRSNSNSHLIMSQISVGGQALKDLNHNQSQAGRQLNSQQLPTNNIEIKLITKNESLQEEDVSSVGVRNLQSEDQSIITHSSLNTNMQASSQQNPLSRQSSSNLNPERKQGLQRKNSETDSTSFTYKEVEKKDDEDSPLKYNQIVEEYVDVDNKDEYTITDREQQYTMSFVVKKEDDSMSQILIKSSDKLRTNLLSKLAYQKVWVGQKPKTHQSCIIFDWDDTILCTSFLIPYPSLIQDPNRKIPPIMAEALEALDSAAEVILKQAKNLGMTFIITNAAEGWVEMSSLRFLPKVHEVLKTGVTIISARTKFEKIYPHNYQEWKIRAFLEAQEVLDNDAITNIVAIGDNNIEIEAAYHLASQFSNAFIKTIKFRETPSIQELTKQLKLVQNQFEQIVTSAKNLTVKLQKFGKNQKDKEQEAEQEEERIVRQRKIFLNKQKSTNSLINQEEDSRKSKNAIVPPQDDFFQSRHQSLSRTAFIEKKAFESKMKRRFSNSPTPAPNIERVNKA